MHTYLWITASPQSSSLLLPSCSELSKGSPQLPTAMPSAALCITAAPTPLRPAVTATTGVLRSRAARHSTWALLLRPSPQWHQRLVPHLACQCKQCPAEQQAILRSRLSHRLPRSQWSPNRVNSRGHTGCTGWCPSTPTCVRWLRGLAHPAKPQVTCQCLHRAAQCADTSPSLER